MLSERILSAMYNCCLPDSSTYKHKSLKGLLYTGNMAVASDNHVMAILTLKQAPAAQDVVIDRDGNRIEAEYPRWRGALPDNPQDFMPGPDFGDLVYACENLDHGKPDNPVFLTINGVSFNPVVLMRVINVYRALNEVPKISVRSNADKEYFKNNRAMFKSESCLAMAMCVQLLNLHETTAVSLEEAIEIGELL